MNSDRVAFELEKLAAEIRAGRFTPMGYVCLLLERQEDADVITGRAHGLSHTQKLGLLAGAIHDYSDGGESAVRTVPPLDA